MTWKVTPAGRRLSQLTSSRYRASSSMTRGGVAGSMGAGGAGRSKSERAASSTASSLGRSAATAGWLLTAAQSGVGGVSQRNGCRVANSKGGWTSRRDHLAQQRQRHVKWQAALLELAESRRAHLCDQRDTRPARSFRVRHGGSLVRGGRRQVVAEPAPDGHPCRDRVAQQGPPTQRDGNTRPSIWRHLASPGVSMSCLSRAPGLTTFARSSARILAAPRTPPRRAEHSASSPQDARAAGLGRPPLLAVPRAREAHRHLRADPSRCASSAVPPHDAAPHAAQGPVHSVRGGLPLLLQGQDRQVAARARPGRRRHRKPRRLGGAPKTATTLRPAAGHPARAPARPDAR